MGNEKTFQRHDMTISVWNKTPKGPVFHDLYDMDTYNEIRALMNNNGFSFHQDPQVKKHYRSIAQYRHCGKRGGLSFTAGVSGMHTEIKFFEPARAINPNGAQYDYDRMKTVSYLGKQRFLLMYRKISELLVSRGFVCTDDPPAVDGLSWLRNRRARDFSGRWAETGNREYIQPISDSNRRDGDGELLTEGDVRYCRDYHGRVIKGRVFYALNWMWYLVSESGAYLTNQPGGRYFKWKPEFAKQRRYVDPTPSLDRELKKAVETENFERAVILRNIKRATQAAKAA